MLRMIPRMTFLAFAFLLATSGVKANASSYLFRLTDAEINEVMTHYYPRGYDRDAILRQMSAPFQCDNFGDLCREVGPDYAYRMVESAWTRARMSFPIEMISRAAETETEDLSVRWFEQSFPVGVPDRDPFWGEERSANACTGSAFATSGDFRIKHSSLRHNLGVLVWGRVKVEHFKRNVLGNFKPAKADRLEVEGNVFLKVAGFDTATVHPVSDTKFDAKQVAATFAFGGIVIASVPFVEGCGGVPNTALWACSCSGTQPALP